MALSSSSAGFPDDGRYADSHEYLRPEGELLRLGITAFAVDQLGDIVFVELPEPGSALGRGTSFGTVESVKAVEEVYARSMARWWSATEPCSITRSSCRTTPTARAGCCWCGPVIPARSTT